MHNSDTELAQRSRQPRRYKLILLSFAGLLAPDYFVPPVLSAVFSGPHLLTVSVTVAGIVALMTFVFISVLTKFVAWWLFEQPSSRPQFRGESEAHSSNLECMLL